MSRFSWMRWLRSHFHHQPTTYRKRGRVLRRPGLEALEDRTMPSVLPPAVVSNQATIAAGFSPDVVMDPVNPLKLVEVHTTGAGLVVQYTTDGGVTWKGLATPANVFDPTLNTFPLPANPVLFSNVNNPTAAMDRGQNLYVLEVEHNALNTVGELLLHRWSFTGAAPTQVSINNLIYRWTLTDPVLNPVVAVDNNLTSFTDTTAGTTQTDTMAGLSADPNHAGLLVPKALYVAWNTNAQAPTPAVAAFNPNVIMAAGSADGGALWTAPQTVNANGYLSEPVPTPPVTHDSDPQIVFTQGSADGRVAGGQLTFVWNDYGNNTIKLDTSEPDGGVATNLAAKSYQFVGTTGTIIDAGIRVNTAAISNAGTGYTIGQVLTVSDGTVPAVPVPPAASNRATLKVTAVGAQSVAIANGGANYAVNDVLTFFGGTGTATTVTVTSVNGGAITGISLTTAGSYTVLPPNPNPVIGGAGTGAQISAVFGVITGISILNPGSYEVPPTAPSPIGVNVGAATFTLTFGSPTPDLPTSTTYTAAVNIPSNFTVNDLSVTLDVYHAHLDQLDVQLVSPGGVTIQLIRNRTNGLGQTVDSNGNPIPPSINPPAGITGVNLGEIGINAVTQTGFLIGTVFDDTAPRIITDAGSAAPYTATYQAEGGNLDVAGIAGQAGNSGNITGTWRLIVTDHKNDGETTAATIPTQRVDFWSLNFSHISTGGFGTDRTVPAAPIAGASSAFAPYPLANTGPYGPAGVGPDVSVAVDNTLGAFSPYEGRLYIAYTSGAGTNTNVSLISGDNLSPTSLTGVTWNRPAVRVNDDSVADNFSEGNRPQFMPTVAVDQVTGTVGVMYYDGRWDPSVYASQSRAANSFSASIDGGQTFSKSTFFNTPKTATDEITGKTITIEPVPGNQSQTGEAFGFGDRQGLVMNAGNVFPVFSSNENAAGAAIKTATVTIAAGPRVVFGDMGPVTADFTSPDASATVYNDTFASDGTRLLNGFVVQFDRPVLVSSFDASQVTVVYRDTVTPASQAGTTLPNSDYTVVPLDAGSAFGLLPQSSDNLLATTFLIQFLPGNEQSAVGTYSYAIGNLTGAPLINDAIKTTTSPTVGNFIDQNQNAITGENPDSFVNSAAIDPNFLGLRYRAGDLLTVRGGTFYTPAKLLVTSVDAFGEIIGVKIVRAGLYTVEPGNVVAVSGGSGDGNALFDLAFTNTPGDVFAAPAPTDGPPFQLPYSQDTLPLIIPGPHVVSTSVAANPHASTTATDNLVLNGTNNAIDVNFDRDIQNATFTPNNIVRITGPIGPISTYSAGPNVTFTGGGGSGATGIATIVRGIVTGVVITNPGSKYTSAPTVAFTGGGGAGATGTAVIAGGTVTAVTVTGGGLGYSAAAQAIPDGGTLSVPIVVPDSLMVDNLAVGVNITHAQMSDLTAWLVAPDGTQVQLFDGGAGNYTNTVFDDGATGSVATAAAPYTGVFRPGTGVVAAVVLAQGSGYKVNDVLTVQGGTFGSPAQLRVTTVSASGAIIGVVLVRPGEYAVQPVSPAAVTGGAGTGATFNLTFGSTLSALNRKNYLGTWTLKVTDNVTNKISGTLNSWTLNPFTVAPVLPANLKAVMSGGTGYKTGDVLTVSGGKFETPAQIFVNAVNSSGAIIGASLNQSGAYTIEPANPAGATGGSGTGATFTLTYPTVTRTFQIGLPYQSVNGTYTVVVGTDPLGNYIQDTNGHAVDTNLNAGVDLLKGGDPISGSIVSNAYPTGLVNTPIPAGSTISSNINVPAAFLVQGVTLQLSIKHQNIPDLTATLIAPDSTAVQLFSGVGTSGSSPHANFTNTTFDDAAPTPIQLASTSPGTGIGVGPFNPQLPLSTFKNLNSQGTWTLRISSNSSTLNGTLVNWTLNLKSSVPGSGLGEPVADQFPASFRVFTQDPTATVAQNQWTAAGPAPIGSDTSGGPESSAGSRTGRIGGLAVDPSDPSGNTVYVAGASGSVWKTSNFLTTDGNGPVYVPLTDMGPGTSLNTGSIAVFGRNKDPNQSIVFVATGEGDTKSSGVGFLRSMDGGKNWRLLDSTVNVDASGNVLPITDPGRDHKFAGTTSYKVIVDPNPTAVGQVIVYAANGSGIWRSTDTGGHWTLLQAGNATDVALSAGSAAAGGNLQILYGAIEGKGVYYALNAPTTATMAIRNGNGLANYRRDLDVSPDTAIPINNDAFNPSGGNGRIVLGVPAATGNPLQDTLYEGWVYAVVISSGGAVQDLYETKDFGLNWTIVRLPVRGTKLNQIPTNDDSIATNYSVTGGTSPSFPAQGEYDISLAVDPNNASVVYVGGTSDSNPYGFIRVDTTKIQDPYAVVAYDNSNNDGGKVQFTTAGGVDIKAGGVSVTTGKGLGLGQPYGMLNQTNPTAPPYSSYFNMLRDPNNPFLTQSSLWFTNILDWTNSGEDNLWGGFDGGGLGGTDQHRLITMRDPLTGHTRLIFGDDQGVWTGMDDGSGNPLSGIGSAVSFIGDRNGNLQITQFYYGAAQPSTLAADVAGAELYGTAQDDGYPKSAANVLDTGNLTWAGPGGDYGGVATDQTGSGTSYVYAWPCCGATPLASDFFLVTVNGGTQVSRITGLIQPGDDPANSKGEWPFLGTVNFAVNPIDPTGIVMSSVGAAPGPNIFLTYGPTLGTGKQWFPIALPGDLDGTQSLAQAFGAPAAPGSTDLNNFIYVGTNGGNIYVTFHGGGAGSGAAVWTKTTGLDGSPVQAIVTNPNRGSHEAYAVTSSGVFWMPDSSVAAPAWTNITGNVFSGALSRVLFDDPNQKLATLKYLTSIQADYRYAIPDAVGGGTHPVLYVGGEGGVYRSFDKGTTWAYFPNVVTDGSVQDGGFLPSAHVTDLSLSVGNLNPANGMPNQPYGRNMLVATTYGRATFVIRLNDAVTVNGVPLSTYAVSPVAGPHVTAVSAVSDGGNGMAGIQVTFSGPVDPVTVTAADINSITDPFGNPIAVQSVTDVTGGNPHNVYEINFVTPTTALGFYHLSLGPNISDYSGNKMDQNQNNLNGENPGDVYVGRFLFQPGTNSAPVLHASTATLPSLNEDQPIATNTGENLIGFIAALMPAPGITDADNPNYAPLTAPVGIAITGIDDTNGTWQYSQDGGATWINIPTVADNSALLLEADAYGPSNRIRFQPNANWNGTSTFTFRAWDLTSGLSVTGADGGFADASINGDPTAFSSTTATTTITVNFVNDQPSFTAKSPPAVNEDAGAQTVTGWVTNFNPGGAPDANESGQSVLRYIVSNVSNPALFAVLPAVDTSGNLTYTLNPNIDGTSKFDVQVQDSGGTANGGIDTSVAKTFTLTVNFVNDQPTFTASNPPAINEDSGSQTVSPWVTNFNPGGAPDPNESSQNVLQYIVSNVTNPALFSVLPAVDTSGNLTYTLNPNVNGTTNFDVQVQDDGGTANGGIDTSVAQTFTLTVNFVNDQPSFTAVNPPAVNEDTTTQQTVSSWAAFNPGGAPDANEVGQSVQQYIVSNVSAPALFAVLPAVDTSGNLTYTLNPNVSGTSTFNVQVQDNGGTANGGIDTSLAKTFTLTVNFVNDQPTFTAASPPAVNEDSGTQTVNGWVTGFNPGGTPDANESGQTVKRYIVTNVTNAGLFSALPAVSAAGTLTYTLKPNVNGTTNFNVQVQDSGGTANGGIDTSVAQTFALTVNFVNDAPSFSAANPPAVNEDSGSHTVNPWATNFNPGGAPDANEAGQTVLRYIVSNVSNSGLFAVLPAVSNSGVLTYTLNANVNGTSTFNVQVQDSGGTANGGIDTSTAKTFTLTVNFVNDQPSFTASNPSAINEDVTTPQTVNGWVTSFNPGGAPDANEAAQTVKRYIVSNITNPSLFAVQPAVSNSGNLTYTLNPNAAGSSNFDVQVQDSGGTANGGIDTSVAQTFTLTVNFVNDQPTFTAANPPAVNEDGGAQTVTGWVTNFNPGGAPDANEAGQAVKQYIVANVTNPGLFAVLPAVDTSGNLTYTLNPNVNGTSKFDVQVQDNGGTANGGIDTSVAQTFTLTVNFVNDQPTFTASNPPAVNEDTTTKQTVSSWAAFNASGDLGGPDANEAGQAVKAYTVSNVTIPGLFSVLPAVDTSGNLTYTLKPNLAGSTNFTVKVQDNGGTANGGVDTSASQTFTLTVNFVNDQPTFTASNPPAINEDVTAPQTVTGWVTNFNPGGAPDANEAGQTVKQYIVTNVTNLGLFAVLPAVSTSGALTYTLNPNASGTSKFDVQVQDSGGTANGGIDTSVAQTFALTVNFVNDQPTFTASNPPAASEDGGAQTVANWAAFNASGDLGGPDANEAGQAVKAYTVSNVTNPGLFSVLPAVDTSGNLTYTLKPNLAGSTNFTVKVQDDGGTANGGIDTSATQTFALTVNFVNDQPTFTANNPPAAFVSTGAHTVPGWVTKFNASGDAGGPDANEASQTVLQYIVSNVTNPALFTVLPAVSNSGVLTYTLAALASGTTNFDVQVQDNGGTANGGIDTSAAQTFVLNVNKYDASVTVTSSASPSSVTGQNVTFTATVKAKAPGTATPAGTVDFLVDGNVVTAGIQLVNGKATAQTAALTVAGSPHAISFNFHDSDLLFNDSTGSLVGGQTVLQAKTSTTVSSSSPSTTFGQTVTFTATVVSVAPGSGVPDGSVTFLVDGVSQGAFSLDTISGQATFSTSSLSVGTRAIKAYYSGSPSYAVSNGTLPGGEVVTKAPTTTGLVPSFNPSRVNEPITYTATVSSPGISVVPTGSVSFYIDGIFRTTGTLVGGQTTFSPGAAALPVGSHTVAGKYAGSGSFQISTGRVVQVVQAPGTTKSTVTITSSEEPSFYGDTVTLTAAVTGAAGIPTGAVTFYLDGINQGTFALDGSGQFQFVPTTLTVANHPVRVAYYGDDTYAAATQSTNQIVNKIPTSTALAASFNPSRRNEPVTFTATVTTPSVVPTGSVSFYIDGIFRTTGTLVGGQATFMPGTAALPVGNHNVSAQYTGTATIAISSDALTQVVKAPGTAVSSIAIFPSEAPSFYGDTVTFTADVTGTSGTPTGAVTFTVNGINQGTFAVDAFGLSQFVVSTLPVGSPTIGATYWGDDTYAVKSGSITQAVNKAVTSTGLTSSANPAVVLTPITFTATVTTAVSGTPAGSVTFFIDGTSQGTVNLSGGQATFVTTSLAVGGHNVVAQYNGSPTLAVSNGLLFPTQQVQNPGTSTANTALTSSLNPSLPSQAVTFTATVTDPNGGGTPSGWVRFMIDNVLGPYVALNGSGQAAETLPSMKGGTHSVYAFYFGDLTYGRSQSPLLTQTVTVIPPASLSASIAQVGMSYTITVLALTSTGAVDTQYNGPVSFTPVLVPSNGSIQGGTTSSFSNGVAQFPGLVFTPAGKYEVEIIDQASGLTLFFTFFIGGRQS